ncbi:MAG: phenylacetate--CoA ligase [Acetobacteraceae bacterium]|nr:phenylacetate--CoA ligase [Acetobacteraceae bacterium]
MHPSGRGTMPEGFDAIETASLDELRALQLSRLKTALRHAHDNVAPYRAKCREHGVHPDDLKQLTDLTLFPFTTKEDFRINYPFGMFAVPTERVARIHASSGTTGKPVVVGYTKHDIDLWAHLVARTIYAAGGRAGEKVHVAYGYGLFTGGLGAHYGAERLGCTVIPMSGGQTEKQVQLIVDFDPEIIMVTPSYLLNIADEMYRQGVDPAKLKLRVGILGAEPWTEAMREEINRRLHMRALDTYGLSEVMGPGVAQECVETEDGPTIWEDHFYPEVIDPDTCEVLPEGSEGELVITCLTKEALPTIRYRTRDITRLLPGTARTMRRIARVTGRSDDMMVVRGVNVFPSQIEEHVLSCPTLAPHYLIEVRRVGTMDRLAVNVELRDDTEAEAGQVASELAHKIKTFIGITAEISVQPAGSILRSQGKAVRVIDYRRR